MIVENKNKALFLDRDGVINIDTGYVYKISQFKFQEGIFDLCKLALDRGYLIIIVTNQAGIGRGLYSQSDFFALTNWMLDEFSCKGVDIANVYYCPYHPFAGIGLYKRSSYDRKPNPGMIISAAIDFGLDLKASIMIGDKESDVIAAHSAGIINSILIGCGDLQPTSARHRFESISEVLNQFTNILNLEG